MCLLSEGDLPLQTVFFRTGFGKAEGKALHSTMTAKPAQKTQLLNGAHRLWNMLPLCVCVWCMAVCAHVYMVHSPVCTHVEAIDQHQVSRFITHRLHFWSRVSPWPRSASWQLESQDVWATTLPLLTVLWLQPRYLNQLLRELCGSKHRSSRTSSEHFPLWAVSPGPEMDPSM